MVFAAPTLGGSLKAVLFVNLSSLQKMEEKRSKKMYVIFEVISRCLKLKIGTTLTN